MEAAESALFAPVITWTFAVEIVPSVVCSQSVPAANRHAVWISGLTFGISSPRHRRELHELLFTVTRRRNEFAGCFHPIIWRNSTCEIGDYCIERVVCQPVVIASCRGNIWISEDISNYKGFPEQSTPVFNFCLFINERQGIRLRYYKRSC